MKMRVAPSPQPSPVGRGGKELLFGKNKVYAAGHKNDISNPFDSRCNINNSERANGRGCTAWIVENGNMDYLHCDDLSWDGKRKCSD